MIFWSRAFSLGSPCPNLVRTESICSWTIESFVFGKVNNSHTTLPDAANDFEVRNVGTDHAWMLSQW